MRGSFSTKAWNEWAERWYWNRENYWRGYLEIRKIIYYYSTPILLLIFNRPDLTERVLAWLKKWNLRGFLSQQMVLEITSLGSMSYVMTQGAWILNNIDWPCEVTTLFRDKNLGCKVAVSSAITWFFEHVESGIIWRWYSTHKSFLVSAVKCFDKYKDKWTNHHQIVGFNLMGDFTEGKLASLFFENRWYMG